MTRSLESLKRRARGLRRDAAAGAAGALARVAAVLGAPRAVSHAEALHVIAREAGAESWPRLKLAVEIAAEDRAARAERLKRALFHGAHGAVAQLLEADPMLGRADFGLACALYDIDGVREVLARDPGAATRIVGVRRPILHLAFSRHIHGGGAAGDMLAVADALLAHGADVNDGFPWEPGADHLLSALYGAVGHGDNMVLARWLLEHGADPNDDESLYHATELGHHEGLRLLIAHGARPAGTNALPRALDFDDLEAARLLLEAGADPNEGVAPHPAGVPLGLVPALHQAARRGCSAATAALLLEHGADPLAEWQGQTAYALARIHGNRAVAEVLEAVGAAPPLSPEAAALAAAAQGTAAPGTRIDPAALPDELSRILTRLVWRDGTLPHLRRLVAMGIDPDMPDEMGMPPLHLAAWEGLPEVMAFFLSLSPDLSHVNGYGGTLLSTVLHGSENCPRRAGRDHLACMRLALEAGVDLPRRAAAAALDPEMAAFLEDWAETHPGQVTAGGVV